MKRFYWSHLILVAVAVAAIAVVAEQPAPVVHAQVPGAAGGTCVLEAVQQATGFSLPFSCEDRQRFTAAAPVLTGGGTCAAPTTGVMLYTQINGQCFPITIVPSPGFVAELPKAGPITVGQLAVLMRQATMQAHPAK